jgi:hypothetical protein
MKNGPVLRQLYALIKGRCTDRQYHSKTFSEMIDLVHRGDICPELNDPGDTSQPLPFAKEEVFRTLAAA